MTKDLYTLLPSFLSCESVDGFDTWHLNHSHKLVINQFKKTFKILTYNNTFFHSPSLTLPSKFINTPNTLKSPSSVPQFNFLLSHPYTKNHKQNILHVILISLLGLYLEPFPFWFISSANFIRIFAFYSMYT